MTKIYITFGQVHTHRVNNQTFDCDCVAVIHCNDHGHGREIAFEHFGPKFAFSYDDPPNMYYFPRGIMNVNEQD